MLYKVLADSVVLVHFLWVLFLIFGAVWGRRNRAVKRIHLFGLIFAVIIETCNWYCPLTHLEVWFRSRHNPAEAYAGSFIIHYLEELLYIQLPRHLVALLTVALAGLNIWLYRGRKMPG